MDPRPKYKSPQAEDDKDNIFSWRGWNGSNVSWKTLLTSNAYENEWYFCTRIHIKTCLKRNLFRPNSLWNAYVLLMTFGEIVLSIDIWICKCAITYIYIWWQSTENSDLTGKTKTTTMGWLSNTTSPCKHAMMMLSWHEKLFRIIGFGEGINRSQFHQICDICFVGITDERTIWFQFNHHWPEIFHCFLNWLKYMDKISQNISMA